MDYYHAYLQLFNAVTDAQALLVRAQQRAEETCIGAPGTRMTPRRVHAQAAHRTRRRAAVPRCCAHLRAASPVMRTARRAG